MTIVASPFTGDVVALDDVADEVFASRTVGDGVAISPTGARVVAPIAGTVAKAFRGGHGWAIETDDGLQVLVHVGLDTVRLEGDGFTPRAGEGDEVVVGDPLVGVDWDRLRELGVDTVSPVVVLSGHAVTVVAGPGGVHAGDPLLEVDTTTA
ncbi:MAG: glucose PTS transporter subunit IIA [Actinomycetota bacterium]|nr:glucose PTS transporter subunit IIA [Actinomycetota bacterium]